MAGPFFFCFFFFLPALDDVKSLLSFFFYRGSIGC